MGCPVNHGSLSHHKEALLIVQDLYAAFNKFCKGDVVGIVALNTLQMGGELIHSP